MATKSYSGSCETHINTYKHVYLKDAPMKGRPHGPGGRLLSLHFPTSQ